MNIGQGDIIIKKGSLFINERLLIRSLGLDISYLRKARCYSKNRWDSWQHKLIHGQWYYKYDTISNRAPHFYRSQLPPYEELVQISKNLKTLKQIDEENNRIITKIVDDYGTNADTLYYMYHSEVKFPQELASQLTRSLAWMRFLSEYHDKNRHTDLGFGKKADFLTITSDIIKEEANEGLKTTNLKSLWKKLYYFPRSGENDQRNYLISGKYGNDNARIVGKFQIVHPETGEIMRFDAHEALMYELWMNPSYGNKRSKYDLYHTEYHHTISEYGIDPVDYRTFCAYINRFSSRAMMSLERDGKKHFNDTYMPYVAAHQVQYSLSMVAADGAGTKLAYQYQDKDGKQKRATLYMVRITDVASRKIIGYSIGDHETPEMVQKAIKMAIKNSGNYGFGDFISDNGPSFSLADTDQLISLVSRKNRKINVGNSQENPAELHVRLLTEFSRKFDNWLYTGFNAHHIDYTANPDYFPANDNLRSYEEAMTQVFDLIEEYNNTPWNGRSPNERFENNIHPSLKKLDDVVIRYCFGNKTEVDVSYMRGFVKCYKTTGDVKKTFQFTIPDYSKNIDVIGKATGYQEDAKVIVCYNQDYADLYTTDGRYILTCPSTELASKTSIEATEETDKALGKLKYRKEEFIEAAEAFRDDVVLSADVFKFGTLVKDTSLNGRVKDEHNRKTEEKLLENIEKAASTPRKKKPVRQSALDQM